MGILVCSREWISTHTLLEILKSIILIYEYKCCLSSKILYHHGDSSPPSVFAVLDGHSLWKWIVGCSQRLWSWSLSDCKTQDSWVKMRTTKKAPWKAWIGRTGTGCLAASDPKIRVRALSSIRVLLGSLLYSWVTHPTKVHVWGNPEIFTYSCLHEKAHWVMIYFYLI